MSSSASTSETAPPAGAVFLSYAREDSVAAQRVADALRAFGVEVWFDQSELRGGDAWDASIRQQIRSCRLFIAVISASTQRRREGYFRREWNLAVERTQDMAHNAPFVLPIVIDETAEAEASIPDAFRRVQWTRLARGVPSTEFVERVTRLLTPAGPAPVRPTIGGRLDTIRPPASRWARRALLIGAAALVTAGLAWWKFGSHAAADASAAGPPVIVMMDSPYPDRVYDPATLKIGGTNADDITDLLRDLPVKLVKESTSSQWRREAQVISENPALIVMHRSCFFTYPESMVNDLYPLVDNKLVAFMGYVATLNPRTRFIIYSRRSWEDAALAAKWRQDAVERFPVLAGKIETYRVPLDRATYRNPITGQELRDLVLKSLGMAEPSPVH
jgi:TIR domain-containing protein